MQNNKIHLASTFIFITLCLSILFLLAISGVMVIGSLVSIFQNNGDAAGQMIMAFAFGFVMILLIACAWFVLEKTRGKEQAQRPFIFTFSIWQIVVALAVVIISIAIGTLVTLTENVWLAWLLLPVLTIFVIVPPIWIIFGLGSKGLALGARWRFFSIFGLGMTVAPFIMIILEILVLGVGLIVGSIYLAVTQPEMVTEITRLSDIISNETNEMVILNLLTPYFTNPTLIAIGISYIAIIVPLIEELFKPLAVWLFAKQIETPAQGFALGLLSGAAFALFESLNASADGSSSWGIIVTARAGTSLLHMTASGLMGWGIVSAFKEKRIGRLVSAYFSAVLIHGLWNAAAVGIGLSAVGESIGKPEWLFNYTPALLCGLLLLGFGMFAVMLASNRKLQTKPAPIQVEEERVQSST
jgi:hypothetical protein